MFEGGGVSETAGMFEGGGVSETAGMFEGGGVSETAGVFEGGGVSETAGMFEGGGDPKAGREVSGVAGDGANLARLRSRSRSAPHSRGSAGRQRLRAGSRSRRTNAGKTMERPRGTVRSRGVAGGGYDSIPPSVIPPDLQRSVPA